MNSLQWHLNRSGLSNVLLLDLLKNIDIGKKYFKGIYAVDNIPKFLSRLEQFIVIINIGMHFVTLYGKPNLLVYIDSFGNPPPSSMKKFLSTCKRKIVSNIKQIQSPYSSHCGLYAVLYVLFFNTREMRKKCKTIVFDKNDLLKNDDICISHIKYYVSLYV
jgi:hypothetical protein